MATEPEHTGYSHCDRWIRESLARFGVPTDRLSEDDIEALLEHVGQLIAGLVRLRRNKAGPWDVDLDAVRRADSAIRELAKKLAKEAPG
jgi:hypothetical protein